MASNSYQPTAPPVPLHGVSAEDDVAPPPSYAEAIAAPAGGSFSSLSRPEGADGGVPLRPPPVVASWADTEVDPAPPDVTITADTAPPPPAAGGSGDEPPSYQSLFGQIKDAKESSSGICDFFTKLFVLPLGCLVVFAGCPVIVIMVVGLVFGLPVSLVTIGSMYFTDCPIAPGIPIWMVVGGVTIIVYIFWVGCTDEKHTTCQSLVGGLFYLAWYISGCVLVYPTWQPKFWPHYPGDTEYCDHTLMVTAFFVINLLSVLTGVLCCTASL